MAGTGQIMSDRRADCLTTPSTVQVIAAPWREDVCLRIAHQLEAAVAALAALDLHDQATAESGAVWRGLRRAR